MLTRLQNQNPVIRLLWRVTPTFCVASVLLFLAVRYAVESQQQQLLVSALAIIVVVIVTFHVFRQSMKRQLMRIYENMVRTDNFGVAVCTVERVINSRFVSMVVSMQVVPETKRDEVHINLTSYTYNIFGSQNFAAGQLPQFHQQLSDEHVE